MSYHISLYSRFDRHPWKPLLGATVRPDVGAPVQPSSIDPIFYSPCSLARRVHAHDGNLITVGTRQPDAVAVAQLMHSHAPQTPRRPCECVRAFGFSVFRSVSIRMSVATHATHSNRWCHTAGWLAGVSRAPRWQSDARACVFMLANVAFAHLF